MNLVGRECRSGNLYNLFYSLRVAILEWRSVDHVLDRNVLGVGYRVAFITGGAGPVSSNVDDA